ncbi:MAG: glycosyltransferase [Actinomycetes bacterium]
MGVRRVGLLSVHTSPLDQPGTGDGGGLNVYVAQVARRLAARGVEVDVFTRATDPAQPPVEELTAGVTVHRVTAGPVAPLPKDELSSHLCGFVTALLRHPLAASHDVLHAHYWLSGWVGRRLTERWGTPFVQTFHTLGLLKNETLAPGDVPEPPLRLVAERRIAHAADRLCVLTCGEARLLHRRLGVSGSRMTVVPAGVDLELFHPEPAAGGDVLPAELAGRAGPMLLFVGRLQPLKGPDVAVDTLAEVRRHRPDAHLVVVGGTSGSGEGRTGPAELEARAAALGVRDGLTVLPARPQHDLAALYRAADVVLAPSRSETFGLVALEAQACGTPVVAADVAGLQATVGAADGGVLVPGHDPAAHAAAVLAYLDDPALAARAGAAGRAHAVRSSWDRTAERLHAVYGELAAARIAVPAAS